jgi:hypothetical protein
LPQSFGKDISWFVTQVGGIRRMLPTFASSATALAREAHDNYDKFIAEHATEKELDADGHIKRYAVPPEQVARHRKVSRALDDTHVFLDALPRMAVIALVSSYDSYLGKLVRSLYAAKPEVLNASNRQLTYAQLSAFSSLEAAREYVVDREVESLLRESHVAQFEWLESKVGIPLRKDLPTWPTFVEVTERRNLFVHTDGIVSAQYLTVCEQEKANSQPPATLGSRLNAPRKYFVRACDAVMEVGVKLGQVLWRKLLPGDLRDADSQLTEVCYELLLLADYPLAATIADFAANGLPRHSSAEYKLIFQVNLAQAYKWAGRADDCEKLLNSIDWRPLSFKFQLAAAVLREEYDAAARLVKNIGTSGEVPKAAYQEWPLFRLLREQPPFHAAYEEAFGEPFKVVGKPPIEASGVHAKLQLVQDTAAQTPERNPASSPSGDLDVEA